MFCPCFFSAGNVFVVGAVFSDKRLWKEGNVFILNLAFADLCVTGSPPFSVCSDFPPPVNPRVIATNLNHVFGYEQAVATTWLRIRSEDIQFLKPAGVFFSHEDLGRPQQKNSVLIERLAFLYTFHIWELRKELFPQYSFRRLAWLVSGGSNQRNG